MIPGELLRWQTEHDITHNGKQTAFNLSGWRIGGNWWTKHFLHCSCLSLTGFSRRSSSGCGTGLQSSAGARRYCWVSCPPQLLVITVMFLSPGLSTAGQCAGEIIPVTPVSSWHHDQQAGPSRSCQEQPGAPPQLFLIHASLAVPSQAAFRLVSDHRSHKIPAFLLLWTWSSAALSTGIYNS